MSVLKPFSKLPNLDTASILLVENEEQVQQGLAEALVEDSAQAVNVRLARSLPLPLENEKTRPRIDLVVFILNLTSDKSFKSANESLKYLDPGYFLGKVCFMVTNARYASGNMGRLDAVRKMAASLHCPLLFAEVQQSPEGVTNAARRLLTILKVASGLVPNTSSLYLSNLTRCTKPPDIDQPSFD
ncbi:PREDICTED: centromere protein M isoform X1 [Cyprinodon variegatus]|uniref:centromere protein M isoform X1 n=1 Tax=Cyprinodon variegatus TaxID=28743 RepID=UPI000742C6A6|nr:PREDICTED: centromere protein M isoform X1 [Cyprinodon variegatus]